jgi:hypothetical protein
MVIKILKTCSGERFTYYAGEVVEAKQETAKELIRAGYAKSLKKVEPKGK